MANYMKNYMKKLFANSSVFVLDSIMATSVTAIVTINEDGYLTPGLDDVGTRYYNAL